MFIIDCIMLVLLIIGGIIWCISFLFREHSPLDRPKHRDHDTKHTDVGVPHHR